MNVERLTGKKHPLFKQPGILQSQLSIWTALYPVLTAGF